MVCTIMDMNVYLLLEALRLVLQSFPSLCPQEVIHNLLAKHSQISSWVVHIRLEQIDTTL